MQETDTLLVIEVIKGNTEAFGLLVEKYQNQMYNLALQITRDADLSKDIVQDSFVKAYQKLSGFDQCRKFFSWIYRIVLNEALNTQKRSGFFIRFDEDNPPHDYSKENNIEKDETSLKVQKALNRLAAKYKSLIVLKHYQALSYEEISEIVKLPPGKVKSRLYIARDSLRKSLENVYNA